MSDSGKTDDRRISPAGVSSNLMPGVCVACARAPGRFYRTCPYCGEQIWWPMWRRVLATTLPVWGGLFSVLTVLLADPDWSRLSQALRSASPLTNFLFVGAGGILLLPLSDADLIVNTRVQRIRWQVLSLCAALWGVGSLAVATTALMFGRTIGWPVCVLAGLTYCSALSLPLFYRVSARAALSTVLLIVALVGMRFDVPFFVQ